MKLWSAANLHILFLQHLYESIEQFQRITCRRVITLGVADQLNSKLRVSIFVHEHVTDAFGMAQQGN